MLGEYLKFLEIILLAGHGLKYRGFRPSPRIPPTSWTLKVKLECILFSVLGENKPQRVNGIFKIFETKTHKGKLPSFAPALKWLPRKVWPVRAARIQHAVIQ